MGDQTDSKEKASWAWGAGVGVQRCTVNRTAPHTHGAEESYRGLTAARKCICCVAEATRRERLLGLPESDLEFITVSYMQSFLPLCPQQDCPRVHVCAHRGVLPCDPRMHCVAC